MNQYNQVPHQTQDTLWERDKNTRKRHIQKRLEVRPFTASDHKTAQTDKAMCQRRTQIKNNPQKKSGAYLKEVFYVYLNKFEIVIAH